MTYGEIVKGIDDTMREAATDAELARSGAGFTYIIDALGVWTGRSNRRAAGSGGKQ